MILTCTSLKPGNKLCPVSALMTLSLAGENAIVWYDQYRSPSQVPDSVLARLVRRGRASEQAIAAFIRVPYLTPGRFSHNTARRYYGRRLAAVRSRSQSRALQPSPLMRSPNANPHTVHITVPKAIRLRRLNQQRIVVHRGTLVQKIRDHEGAHSRQSREDCLWAFSSQPSAST